MYKIKINLFYKGKMLFLTLLLFLSVGIFFVTTHVYAFCGYDISTDQTTNITQTSATINGTYNGSIGCNLTNLEGLFDWAHHPVIIR